MNLKELSKRAHDMAVSKGWWDKELTPLEVHMLIVSELAEATEEVRKGNPALYFTNESGVKESTSQNFSAWEFPKGKKPEGELIELADAVIRILDYCAYRGWDLENAIKIKMEFNSTRPYRHGGKLK